MPRGIVVGNGRLTVALDGSMAMRDLFFPMVGLENHQVNHRSMIGVWVQGRFSWMGPGWDIRMRYLPETIVSRCSARNSGLEIELEVNDAVHILHNVFLRKVRVTNLSRSGREVRVFFSHDLHIYGEDTGDTVMYEPARRCMIHYKRQRYFLIDGRTDGQDGIHQFAAGCKESPNREGTWRDAEDGTLDGNPIAQGSVDSAVSFRLDLAPGSTRDLYYWIACGQSLPSVKNLDSQVLSAGVEQMLLETENYWSAWLNRQDVDLGLLPRDLVRMFKTSLLVMRTHADNGGAVIASCDSEVLQFNRDTYAYVWPRDGAIAAMAFDMAGFGEVTRPFFQFCNEVISEDGYFYHKYSTDGSMGSSWHGLIDVNGQAQLPIQEDETALVLQALWHHFLKYRDVEFIGQIYPNLILRAAEFLLRHTDDSTGLPRPSFDVWEEQHGVFTSTAATVCSALEAAAEFARVFYDRERHDRLMKAAARMKQAILDHMYDRATARFARALRPDGSLDMTVDSALAFLFAYGPFRARDAAVEGTMRAVIDSLWTRAGSGGLARYENDAYQRVAADTPGNPWVITTLWLARWHIARAASVDELAKGLQLLNWCQRHSSTAGLLAEQLDPHSGMPISVSPLLWSHAEYVIAVCQYVHRHRQLLSGGQVPSGAEVPLS